MNFTLVFPNSESDELSVAMMFISCAAWVEGNKILVIPNPRTPHYELGYLRVLLDLPSIAARLHAPHKQLAVIVHQIGHGTSEDLAKLLQDCADEGYSANIINLPPQA
jgi:hypothetical protein